jgi:hypothetical protein
MAPFTVALEHPVVVLVMSVHAPIALLDLLLSLQPVMHVMPVPAASLDELLMGPFGDGFTFGFVHVVLPFVNVMAHKANVHKLDGPASIFRALEELFDGRWINEGYPGARTESGCSGAF